VCVQSECNCIKLYKSVNEHRQSNEKKYENKIKWKQGVLTPCKAKT